MNSEALDLSPSDPPTRKRKRTACRTCRDRRIKCDNGRPTCQSCCNLKLPCVYPDDVSSAHTKFDPGSVEILNQLQEIRAMLDHVVQTHAGSRASSRHSSTFESSRRPMLGFEMPNSPRVESHGNVHGRNNNGDCSSNGPRTGIEGLLYWPRIVDFLGTPVVEQSFVLESTLNSAKGTAPAPRYKQYGIRENDLPTLCRRFLVYVHIRNPILEPGELEQYAKELSETGIKWDSKSCLVLLACGLGCLASEIYDKHHEDLDDNSIKDDASYARAEAYYEAACKRIGSLGTELLDIQCLYLAGIYEKHMLRILQAWFWTEQACSRLYAYLLCRSRPAESCEHNDRRIEQRLYWSCIKAESEFLKELPLPRSALISLDYPDSFPSPPTLPELYNERSGTITRDVSFSKSQEYSWLYYLAEIALRRTLDHALPLVYLPEGPKVWMKNINYVSQQFTHIDHQLTTWYEHLPLVIRPSQDPEIVPSHQLSCLLQGRFLGGKEAILRPFLYYTLHHDGPVDRHVILRANEYVKLASGLIIHLSKQGRHGGIWYALRGIWGLAMVILTVERANIKDLHSPVNLSDLMKISSRMLCTWSSEAPDVRQMYDILGRALLIVCPEAF